MKIRLILQHLFSFGWLRRCHNCSYRGAKCICDSRPTNALEHIFYLESRKTVSRDQMRTSSKKNSILSAANSADEHSSIVQSQLSADSKNSIIMEESTDSYRAHLQRRSVMGDSIPENPISLTKRRASRKLSRDYTSQRKSQERSKQRNSKNMALYSCEQMNELSLIPAELDFDPHATMDLHRDFIIPERNGVLQSSQNMQLSKGYSGLLKLNRSSHNLRALVGTNLGSSLAASMGSHNNASPTSDMTSSRAWIMNTNLTIDLICEEGDALKQLQGWLKQSSTSSSFMDTYNV